MNNKSNSRWPVYLPALVLIDGLSLAYVAASGWQYPEKPWTLYLMVPSAAGMLVSFILMLFGHFLSILFLLFSILLSLPYFIPVYIQVLIYIIGGHKGYLFTGLVLSLIILLISFTVFRALHPKPKA